MNRRATLQWIFALAAAPLAVHAQAPARAARVGILVTGSIESSDHFLSAAKGRLRELGYVEGRNLVLVMREAKGDSARLPAIVGEIIAQKPDVIIAGSMMGLAALRPATSTIPIVMAAGDVAGTGQVKNLARPEGNITGVSALQVEMGSKMLELALTINPRGMPLAVLGNPSGPLFARLLKELQDGTAKAGIGLVVLTARSAGEIEQAFAQLARERVRTLMVATDGFYMQQRRQIAEQGLGAKIAVVAARREYVEAGGLISYGSDLAEGFRLAAAYVDRILKGAKPADLPIQQPSKFELAVNLRTAKAIGVSMPREILMRADVTIQ